MEQGRVPEKVVSRQLHSKVQMCMTLVLADIFARTLISLEKQVFESIFAKIEHCGYIPLRLPQDIVDRCIRPYSIQHFEALLSLLSPKMFRRHED